ncbi:MAG: hypothetical protein WCG85_11160 [Polyangia bacterium]
MATALAEAVQQLAPHPVRYIRLMLDVKRVVFGLAAIAGLGGATPGARAALPDDGPVVFSLPDSARQTPASPEATSDASVNVPAPSEKALG